MSDHFFRCASQMPNGTVAPLQYATQYTILLSAPKTSEGGTDGRERTEEIRLFVMKRIYSRTAIANT